jgi:hypothetical protein
MTRLLLVALVVALLGCATLAYQSMNGYPCGTADFSCQYNKMARSLRRLY